MEIYLSGKKFELFKQVVKCFILDMEVSHGYTHSIIPNHHIYLFGYTSC